MSHCLCDYGAVLALLEVSLAVFYNPSRHNADTQRIISITMTIIITSVFRSLFLSVILVAPISTTGHTLRGPLPPSGLSFTRTISDIPGSFDLQFDGNHCQLQDDYGDNECHFDWGEDITGRYKVQIDEDIVEGDVLEGHFKVRSSRYRNALTKNNIGKICSQLC